MRVSNNEENFKNEVVSAMVIKHMENHVCMDPYTSDMHSPLKNRLGNKLGDNSLHGIIKKIWCSKAHSEPWLFWGHSSSSFKEST